MNHQLEFASLGRIWRFEPSRDGGVRITRDGEFLGEIGVCGVRILRGWLADQAPHSGA